MTRPIHVVVPVYRDVPLTQRCLESLAASDLPPNCLVTLIDDAAPDPAMPGMLASFAQRLGCEVLRNPINCGFVASANLGMLLHPDHDIVLLNSDTEVPPGWLQRLQSIAYRYRDTGTVTPFSNAGSLASYPLANIENLLPSDCSLLELDRLFHHANADIEINVPTGVGFCLFIRRDCLDETGKFDEVAFGKGYGEENDFCLRSSALGWKHVLAADCFVYHRGRGSFGAEKDDRVKHAYALLVSRYPHYGSLVQRHVLADPARVFRQRVDAMRLSRIGHSTLALDSPSPKVADGMGKAAPLLSLLTSRTGQCELRWVNHGEGLSLWFHLPKDASDLLSFLLAVGVSDFDCLRHSPYFQKFFHEILERSQDQIGRTELLDLVTRHGKPQRTLMQSFIRMLARLVLHLGEIQLLHTPVSWISSDARTQLKQWLRNGQA